MARALRMLFLGPRDTAVSTRYIPDQMYLHLKITPLSLHIPHLLYLRRANGWSNHHERQLAMEALSLRRFDMERLI